MPSTASDLLKIELQATGENNNTWGGNNNIVLQRLEEAIAKHISINVAAADYTLDDTQYVKHSAGTAESHVFALNCTGALAGNRAVIVPARSKMYLVTNSTTESYTLTVKTSAGTGVTVAAGASNLVFCDGTNVIRAANVGDTVGPASATADSLARFDGTTGKLLKDGAVIGTDVQAFQAAQDTAVWETGAGTTESVVSPAKVAAAIAALASASGVDRSARDDIAALAFHLASTSALVKFGLANGIVDGFEDETGIDTGAAVNAFYYQKSHVLSAVGYTKSGNMNYGYGGSLTATNDSKFEDAFSGVVGANSTPYTNISICKNDISANRTLAIDWGAPRLVTHAVFKAPTDVGYGSTISTVLYFEGSSNGSSWTTLWTSPTLPTGGAAGQILTTTSTSTAYRHHRLRINNDISYHSFIGEIEYYGSTSIYVSEDAAHYANTGPAAMTLPTIAFTAQSAPDTVVVDFQIDPATAVAGTDYYYEASRDGGTTWTTGDTPVKLAENVEGLELRRTVVDVSGQPSGINIKARLITTDTDVVELYGHAVNWGA